jgi:hypothetical protein
MKKLSALMLGLSCILSFSFFKNSQKTLYRKLATNLYQTKAFVPMSEAHQTNMRNILMKAYGIKSFDAETTISFKKVTLTKDPSKVLGFTMAEKTVGHSVFMETMVDKGAGEVDEVTYANNTIPTSGHDNAAVAELGSILSNYKN